jgi:protein O-mannosyl-transferase
MLPATTRPIASWLGSGRRVVVLGAVLAVLTLSVYLQAGNHPFLAFDDKVYVTENPHVSGGLTGTNVLWALTSVDVFNWHPLTWLSHMSDVELYGMDPRGHHLTNVGLHAVSAVLLLVLLFRITGGVWQSFFVAALFALHPLHVESVAWVAERKDVLSALFWMLSLLFYAAYAARRGTDSRGEGRGTGSCEASPLGPYLGSLLCFMLGLMSKPMLVTLPLVMLLVDLWPLGRLRLDAREPGEAGWPGRAMLLIREKIPFFVCSLGSGIVTIYAQHTGGATRSLVAVPFLLRVENALTAYLSYLGKIFWPRDLAILYPYPSAIPLWQAAAALLLLGAVSAAALRYARRYPFLATGWFWYLVTLLPVIGILQVGDQSMADRYSYLPSIGISIMIAWGVPELVAGWKQGRVLLALAACGVLVALTALTWHQLGYWRDGITLYRHTLQVTSANPIITYNLGVAHAELGDLDAAMESYREVLRMQPAEVKALNNLGMAFAARGDWGGAIRTYREGLRSNPGNAPLHFNLGIALAATGDLEGALGQYREAVRISPEDLGPHNNMGIILARRGDLAAALGEFRQAVRINPEDFESRSNLGRALADKGDLDAAIGEFRQALQLRPNAPQARSNLEEALARRGGVGR